MRISDDRYSRDRQRYDLALRFIQHEARTSTIRAWTGLSDDRIRKLCRTYGATESSAPVTRHRGKSPQQIAFFVRSPQMRQEASVFASVCYLLGVMPSPTVAEYLRPDMQRGTVLCDAYETYQRLIPTAHITFEHAVFLVAALARGDELHVGPCADCSVMIVLDRYTPAVQRCLACDEPLLRRVVPRD